MELSNVFPLQYRSTDIFIGVYIDYIPVGVSEKTANDCETSDINSLCSRGNGIPPTLPTLERCSESSNLT